jgi:hypothetical protein
MSEVLPHSPKMNPHALLLRSCMSGDATPEGELVMLQKVERLEATLVLYNM